MSSSPPQPTNTYVDATTPASARSDGLFQNGVWYCNCPSRGAAVVRTVGKNSTNYGRQFYCCRKDSRAQNACGFFLWVEDADAREREFSSYRSSLKQMTLHKSFASAAPTQATISPPPSPPSPPPPSLIDANGSPRNGRVSTSGYNPGGTRPQRVDLNDASSDEEVEIISPTKPRGANRNPNFANNLSSSAVPGTPRAQSAMSKRGRPSSEEQEVDLLDDLSESAEEELIIRTDQSARQYNALGKRPEQLGMDIDTTPSASRTTNVNAPANGLPTPSNTRASGRPGRRGLLCREFFETGGSSSSNTSNAKRQRLNDKDLKDKGKNTETLSLATPQQHEAARLFGTDRTIDASTSASTSFSFSSSSSSTARAPRGSIGSGPTSSSGSSSSNKDLTKEIMDLLKDEKINDSTYSKLHKTLDRHAVLTKTLEARIAELYNKIANLENSRRTMRTALMEIYQNT